MTDWRVEKDRIADRLRDCQTVGQLREVWADERDALAALQAGDGVMFAQTVNLKDYQKRMLGT